MIKIKHGSLPKSKREWAFLFILGSLLIFFKPALCSCRGEEREGGVVSVKTFVSQDAVHPGGAFKVAFLLNILPGWHIHGAELADQFLIPSTLMIEENDEVTVLHTYYPEAVSRLYGYSEVELQVYEGEVALAVLLKISDDASAGDKTVKASFLFQACDNQSCLAPETLDLKIPFRVAPASEKVTEINQKIFARIRFE
jgi:thiol:disulfide interchange protein DsbD